MVMPVMDDEMSSVRRCPITNPWTDSLVLFLSVFLCVRERFLLPLKNRCALCVLCAEILNVILLKYLTIIVTWILRATFLLSFAPAVCRMEVSEL
jgi:hypothetical protein